MEEQNEEYEIDLSIVFKEIIHKIWIVILISVVCGLLGYMVGKNSSTSTYITGYSAYFDYNEKLIENEDGILIDLNDRKNPDELINYYRIILENNIGNLDLDENISITSEKDETLSHVLNVTIKSNDKESILENQKVVQDYVNDELNKEYDDFKISLFCDNKVSENIVDKSFSNLTIGFLFGAFISCALIAFYSILQDKVFDKKQFEQRTKYIVLNDDAKKSKDYDGTLRTNLICTLNDCKTFAIANVKGEFTDSNKFISLAESFNDIGKKIAVVNLNFRNKDIQQKPESSSFVNKEIKNGVTYVDFNTNNDNISSVLNNNSLISSIENLKNNHDYVMCLLPSIVDYPDTMISSEYIDCIVPVVYRRKTKYSDVKLADERVKLSKGKIIGFIIFD